MIVNHRTANEVTFEGRYRAVCSCDWHGPWRPDMSTATTDGDRHMAVHDPPSDTR